MPEVELDEHGHVRLAELELDRLLAKQVKDRFKERGQKITVEGKNIGYELRCAPPIPFDIEYTRDLGYSAVDYLKRALEGDESGGMITIQEGHMVALPFGSFNDPETGRVRIRLVNVESSSYRVAREYMIRLDREDLGDPQKLRPIAEASGLTPEPSATGTAIWPRAEPRRRAARAVGEPAAEPPGPSARTPDEEDHPDDIAARRRLHRGIECDWATAGRSLGRLPRTICALDARAAGKELCLEMTCQPSSQVPPMPDAPVLLVVDDDLRARGVVEGELRERYGADYQVIGARSVDDPPGLLARLRDDRRLAQRRSGRSPDARNGRDTVGGAGPAVPRDGPKRLLPDRYGYGSLPEPILQAIALGHIDAYAARPATVPDEEFHLAGHRDA